MLLITDALAPPAVDTGLSSALLELVARGDLGQTLRLWTPERTVAFGRQDAVRPGYPDALAAVREHGYTAVERLAGGRAAVFHEGTLAFSWALPEPKPRETIRSRFELISGLVRDALHSLGADARIGEVPGEYCPGDWSVNLRGVRKVMGVGQRLVKGGAHIGGVIVVDRADLVNLPLRDAYRHLGYSWDPEATGAMTDDIAVSLSDVKTALLAAFSAAGRPPEPGPLPAAAAERAGELAARHRPGIA